MFKVHIGDIRRRQWQPTRVLLPGESHGRRSLVGCRLWGCTESDMTEVTQQWMELKFGGEWIHVYVQLGPFAVYLHYHNIVKKKKIACFKDTKIFCYGFFWFVYFHFQIYILFGIYFCELCKVRDHDTMFLQGYPVDPASFI